jgi:hypothetical protein
MAYAIIARRSCYGGLPPSKAGGTIITNWPAEEKLMSSSDTHPTVGIVRSVADRPIHKWAVIAIPAFLLATAFTLEGAPKATAAPAVSNHSIVAFWDPGECRGNKPGVCRDYSAGPTNQQGTLNPQGTLNQPQQGTPRQGTTSPNQHITTHQSPSPQR